MSRHPYVDRNPCVVAAGKLFNVQNESVKSTLQEVTLEEKIDVIKRQLGVLDTKSYAADFIKPPDQDTLGTICVDEIKECIRPPEPNFFQALNAEIKDAIYDSYWNKALGKCRDPTPGLPVGMDPERVTMGKPTKFDIPAGELINPPKKSDEEELIEYLFYKDRGPGVQTVYGYKPPFNKNDTFGISSKLDESGAKVKESLIWFNNDPICHVSRRLAAVRNRKLPPLGKVLDRTGVTDSVPEDYVFGKPSQFDFYGTEDLLNQWPPSLVRRDMITFLSYVNSLRECVAKKIDNGDIVLEEIYEELLNLDKNKKEDPSCCVHFDCIDKIMKRHRIYLDRNKIDPLLLMLGKLSKEGFIKVRDFITIIDKNSNFPVIKKQHYISPPEFEECDKATPCEDENPKNDYLIQAMPPAGKPTVRIDKPYPIYSYSTINKSNLSEETSARTLISPSIYTQYGLSHRDFFQPRSKEFLGSLFRKTNVDLSDEDLDDIYKEGYELDQTGGVCVETFRNILDDRAYKEYNKFNT